MAGSTLTIAGAIVGNMILPGIGGMIGAAAGGMIGGAIDQSMAKPRQAAQMDITGVSSVEGSPIPRAFGKVRVGGMLVWATRFNRSSGSSHAGKGSPAGTSTTDTYTANFAVAICLGQIYNVTRVWFDGKEQNLSTLPWRLYYGSTSQTADSLIVAKEGAAWAPAFRGICYAVFEGLDLTNVGNRIPQVSFEVWSTSAGTETMDNIVSTLCSDAGVDTGLIDVTDIASITVSGYVYPGSQTVREAIAPLAELYGFDGFESGGNVVFKRRGANPTVTVALADMTAASGPNADPFTIERQQETDLDALMGVSFVNADNDKYWQETTYVRRRVDGGKRERRLRLAHATRRHAARSVTINAPYDEITARAQMLLDDEWVGREHLTTTLGPDWLGIEPGDSFTLDVNGLLRGFLVVRTSYSGAVEIQARSYEPSAYDIIIAPAPTTSTQPAAGTTPTTDPTPVTTTPVDIGGAGGTDGGGNTESLGAGGSGVGGDITGGI